MSTESSTVEATRRRLIARIRRFDAQVARLRAMEASGRAMRARDFRAEDHLRGSLFDKSESLAADINAYALTATAPHEPVGRVAVRAALLFVSAPEAQRWFYR
jgi:hypothetical protein